ncbi:MAG: type II toxin-antitoxin system RelB/DinJ family antitoxin [Synergistaceae bacterium]|nr:type II toxin-antitoxin system RelB/DinJ family antitoxin [Synergistaceae bacterium]
MAQTMVNLRMDSELKKGMEQACKDMGLTMSAAFTIFATKVSKERRIPFDLTAESDPLYTEANMERLHRSIVQMEATGGTVHELIEAEDD